MRQIRSRNRGRGGAECADLTMSVSITGVSISGSLSDWSSASTMP